MLPEPIRKGRLLALLATLPPMDEPFPDVDEDSPPEAPACVTHCTFKRQQSQRPRSACSSRVRATSSPTRNPPGHPRSACGGAHVRPGPGARGPPLAAALGPFGTARGRHTRPDTRRGLGAVLRVVYRQSSDTHQIRMTSAPGERRVVRVFRSARPGKVAGSGHHPRLDNFEVNCPGV